MSTLNVLAEPDRISVLVDTRCVATYGGSEHFSASKLVPLVHLNAVIALRGEGRVLALLFAMGNEVRGGDFDQLARTMPAIFEEARRVVGDAFSAEVVLAGWSPARSQMVALGFRSERPGQCEEREISTYSFAPREGLTAEQLSAVTSISDVLSLAEVQIRHQLRRAANAPFGGPMVLAEVTRDAMTIRTLVPFE